MKFSDISNINETVKQFNSDVRDAAMMSMGMKIINNPKKLVPWWDENCKKVIRQHKKALYSYKKNKTIENLITLKKYKALARRTILDRKSKSWQNFTSSITSATPSTQIWEKIRKINGRGKTHTSTTIIKDKKTETNPEKIVEMFADHFGFISSDNNYEKTFLEFKKNKE